MKRSEQDGAEKGRAELACGGAADVGTWGGDGCEVAPRSRLYVRRCGSEYERHRHRRWWKGGRYVQTGQDPEGSVQAVQLTGRQADGGERDEHEDRAVLPKLQRTNKNESDAKNSSCLSLAVVCIGFAECFRFLACILTPIPRHLGIYLPACSLSCLLACSLASCVFVYGYRRTFG